VQKYLMSISAAVLVAVAAGCGGDAGSTANEAGATSTTSSSASAAAEYNDQDVTFAQMMIPHHQQALDMAKLADEKATDPKVKDLASSIEAAQSPEIEQLTTMLETWGAQAEPSGTAHGEGHGMMTDDQMTRLGQATGAAFDALWLQMMIEHHEGAVTMAKDQLEQGNNPDARTLAQQVVTTQEAEITQMRGMLA
jgi:uncharacterized protein (DUF305 family)